VTHELLDIGQGRRLERFGSVVVDRPCPPAEDWPLGDGGAWSKAVLRHDAAGWNGPTEPWTLSLDGLTFELRPTESGQVGLFPEQRPHWAWIRDPCATAGGPLTVLNLFGYTGGITLSAAAAGARVTHVDAARTAVAWARRNAQLSGLAGAPVRWIVDDAAGFVGRELRRGNRYDGVVLDPPSYGHGPKGEPWRIGQTLPPLLAACLRLTAGSQAFVLLTAHSAGLGSDALGGVLWQALHDVGEADRAIEDGPLELTAVDGRRLPLGAYARTA
jgi:23S rRNA (cytosine1962-C5)-methyltransferase